MAENKTQRTWTIKPIYRAWVATFVSSLAIYIVNHATELHIAPWAAAILAGIAATVAAITPSNEGAK